MSLSLACSAELAFAKRAAEGGQGWRGYRGSRLLLLLHFLFLPPQESPFFQLEQQAALVAEAGLGLGAVRSQVKAQAGTLTCPMATVGAGEGVGTSVDARVQGQNAVETEALAADGARVRARLAS